VLQRYHDPGGAATFELLPAIDLRGGRVVRLREGDFSRETTYSDDPAAVAADFAAAGARWIHLVDLDGARAGEPRQLDAAGAVLTAASPACSVELAGGMRGVEAVDAALALGARRVVIGTAAVRDPGFARTLVSRFGPDRIVAALDVRGGRVVGEAWRAGAEGEPAEEILQRLADAGIERFEVTAIDRDGSLAGPDLALLDELIRLDRGAVIASAGISSLDDLRAVQALGCSGAIVGRALYEGRLDLRAALEAVGVPGDP
jgi:phosphoribosylformimino-5-aminoimidazole carboxamide ribotide isomerase